MNSRRTVLLTAAAALAAAPVRAGMSSDAVFPGPVTDETPKASVIPGKPPVLDFADDGLKIACDKSAFLTLWEGKRFWLTFGAGRSPYHLRAQGEAVLYALGAMKLLLMTLAFTPERLARENGGWRLKHQDVNNYVLGDIALPGKPYWPINDANFVGFGQSDAPSLGGAAGNANPNANAMNVDPAMMLNRVDAYTTYVVSKKVVSLDFVRFHAQLLVR